MTRYKTFSYGMAFVPDGLLFLMKCRLICNVFVDFALSYVLILLKNEEIAYCLLVEDNY